MKPATKASASMVTMATMATVKQAGQRQQQQKVAGKGQAQSLCTLAVRCCADPSAAAPATLP